MKETLDAIRKHGFSVILGLLVALGLFVFKQASAQVADEKIAAYNVVVKGLFDQRDKEFKAWVDAHHDWSVNVLQQLNSADMERMSEIKELRGTIKDLTAAVNELGLKVAVLNAKEKK